MPAPTQIGALTDFTPNTTIQSAQVDANFSAIRTQFNALVNSAGGLYVGDDANATVTLGVTINQGPADDIILSLKSSDVGTGITTMFSPTVETDDFLVINKVSPTLGGANLIALAEDGATSGVLRLQAYGGTADTTKSTAGRALVEAYAAEHDGANALANITNDGNVFGVRCRRGGADVTLELIDEDGDKWIGGGMTVVGLAGVGTRAVVVDANGVMSAP